MEDLDKVILVALDRLAQTSKVLLWDQAKEKKMSPIQIQFIVYISGLPDGKSSVSEIAKEFKLTAPTVSDAVKTLENKGLIFREANIVDRRRSFLKLTVAGQELSQSLEHWDDQLLARIGEFPLHTKETVLTFLFELLELLEKNENLPNVKTCFSCGYFERNSDAAENEGSHSCLFRHVRLENRELRLNCPNYIKRVESTQ